MMQSVVFTEQAQPDMMIIAGIFKKYGTRRL